MNFTVKDIESKLYNLLSKSTAKIYYTRILKIIEIFPEERVRDIFSDNKRIIDWVYGNPKFKTTTTHRAWLSAYLFVLSEFDFPIPMRRSISTLIHASVKKSMIDQKEKLVDELLSPKIARNTFKNLKNKYDSYKKAIIPDKYTPSSMYAMYLYLVIHYGVIRLSELISVQIIDGESENPNYINRKKQLLIIRDHKTMKYLPIKEIELDDEFMGLIKHAENLFVTARGNKRYDTADGLDKRLYKELGISHYELRKMKSSLAIASGDIPAIERLEQVQGHNLSTQLNYYNKYAKSAADDDSTDDEI